MAAPTDSVLINALETELKRAEQMLADALRAAGSTLKVHGGQASTPRIAAQQVVDSITYRIHYFDSVADRLKLARDGAQLRGDAL